MYRLLLFSMLLWLLSHRALADENGRHQPDRLQARQLHGRPIEPANSQSSPGFDGDPGLFQSPERKDSVSHSTPVRASAETPVAPHHLSPPAADSTKTVKAAGLTAPQSTWASLSETRDRVSERRGHVDAPNQSRSNLPPADAPLPISRSSVAQPVAGSDQGPTKSEGEKATSTGIDSLITVAGSLGIVLGLFLVTMWCLRRGMPKSARSLPPEVVEVLGRATLAGKQQMHLIRFGNKLVLAAVSPAGVDTISEITDPVEADRLAGYCEQTRSSSATTSFRAILDRLDERGTDDGAQENPRRPSRGLGSLIGLKGRGAEDGYV